MRGLAAHDGGNLGIKSVTLWQDFFRFDSKSKKGSAAHNHACMHADYNFEFFFFLFQLQTHQLDIENLQCVSIKYKVSYLNRGKGVRNDCCSYSDMLPFPKLGWVNHHFMKREATLGNNYCLVEIKKKKASKQVIYLFIIIRLRIKIDFDYLSKFLFCINNQNCYIPHNRRRKIGFCF